jgi:hypothetical protein
MAAIAGPVKHIADVSIRVDARIEGGSHVYRAQIVVRPARLHRNKNHNNNNSAYPNNPAHGYCPS